MARGFVRLVAVIDLFSGRVLAWRLSINTDTSFRIEAPGESLSHTAGRRSSTPTKARSARALPSAGGRISEEDYAEAAADLNDLEYLRRFQMGLASC